jgi:hypothetical protein
LSTFTQADIDRAVAAERDRCHAIMTLPSNPSKGTGLMRQCIGQGMTVQEADQWMRDAPERMARVSRGAGFIAAEANSDSDAAVSASWDRAFNSGKTPEAAADFWSSVRSKKD